MPDTHLTFRNRLRRFFYQHPGLLFWCIGVLAASALTFMFFAFFAHRHGGMQ